MTPSGRDATASRAAKTVVDFSIMTDREVMDYILHYAHGDTCGHVNESQLNRLIQRPPERKTSWKYFWSLALSSLLISYRVDCAGETTGSEIGGPAVDKNRQEDMLVVGKLLPRVSVADDGTISEQLELLRGRVIDEDGQPVPFATIKLKNPSLMIAAEPKDGIPFMWRISAKTEITISAVGYEAMASKKLRGKFL